MYNKEKIQELQSYYQKLSELLLAGLRSDELLTPGSQERHEASMFYDRWLAKSKVLLLILNDSSAPIRPNEADKETP